MLRRTAHASLRSRGRVGASSDGALPLPEQRRAGGVVLAHRQTRLHAEHEPPGRPPLGLRRGGEAGALHAREGEAVGVEGGGVAAHRGGGRGGTGEGGAPREGGEQLLTVLGVLRERRPLVLLLEVVQGALLVRVVELGRPQGVEGSPGGVGAPGAGHAQAPVARTRLPVKQHG